MQTKIRKVAVIGSGVMGGGIAALLAGAGIQTLLLDIIPPDLTEDEQKDPQARNRIAKSGLDNLAAAKPALLMQPKDLDLITIGNLEDNFDQISDCDWVVEVVVEIAGGKRVAARRVLVRGKLAAVVDAPVDRLRLVSEHLHDVDLAAGRPAAVRIVRWHHPERRPEPLSDRQLRPHLEATPLPVGQVLRANARGGVRVSAERLLLRGDREEAAAHRGVLRAVVLQLVVAPAAEVRAAVSDLRLPLRGIECRAIELVLPDELVLSVDGSGRDQRDSRQVCEIAQHGDLQWSGGLVYSTPCRRGS